MLYLWLHSRTETKKNEAPLKGLKFVLDSKLDRPKEDVEEIIKKFGGEVGSRVSEKIAAVISTKGKIVFPIQSFV